jgi:hypothetical protein
VQGKEKDMARSASEARGQLKCREKQRTQQGVQEQDKCREIKGAARSILRQSKDTVRILQG